MEVRDRSRLTQREAEVAGRVALGELNKEIGFHLGIAESTVKNHIGAIREKLNVHSRVQLALAAVSPLLERVAREMFEAGFNLGVTVDREALRDSHSKVNSIPDLKTAIKGHFGEN